ncbi:MAG TPA: hypothetical protein VFH46_09910 [Pyrinomonadaceae bacterium]|nr:hypothetical protein [Pyrinomonadaceae bacterium]
MRVNLWLIFKSDRSFHRVTSFQRPIRVMDVLPNVLRAAIPPNDKWDQENA